MKKLGGIFVLGYFFVFLLSSTVLPEDINNIVEDFYNGLAEVIERNKDNPEEAVKEVGDYYRNNQEAVKKIRQQAEKAMEQIAPQIDKYMLMAEEEVAALAGQQHQKGRESASQAQMSAAAQRYTEVLKAFTMKHPKYAMQIIGQAMQLFPELGKKQKDISSS